MLKRRTLFAAALVAPAAVFAIAVGGAGRGGLDDTAQVKKITTDFKEAWNKHDAKAVAALWARDGDLICPDGKISPDAQAVEKFFTDEYGASGMMRTANLDIRKDVVRFITPDVALSDLDCVVTGVKDSAGTDAGPMVNHVTVISKKEGGGWKIAAARPQMPHPEGEKSEYPMKQPKKME
jgi:uncharacterized protein (TIGR02246 family)